MPWVYIQTKDKFDGPIFGGLIYRGAYIWEEKDFNLQSIKLAFLSFFHYKAIILAFFTSCKI